MDYTKSECDDDIKPQGVVSNIIIPDSYENFDPNSNNEFSAPTESFVPETEEGIVEDSDIHPDGVGQDDNSEHDFVVEEDDADQLLSTEILDDAESDDEVEF